MISISTVNVPPDQSVSPKRSRDARGPKHARHPQIKGFGLRSSAWTSCFAKSRPTRPRSASFSHGSRAAGSEHADSDYDLIRVVTEEEYERRDRHVKDGVTDVVLQTPERLRRLVGDRGWYTSLFLSARVIVDKTGEVEGLVRAIVDAANEAAYAAVAEEYDGYLNCWTRSMKAWRRGDDLGGRLQAAQSSGYLVRALFGLEHRWPPYLDALAPALPAIEQAQGWGDGFLRDALLRLAGDGDPVFQQAFEARVEALMAARGFQHEWPEDELEALKALRFPS